MSAKVVHRSGIAVSAVALFALTGCLEREKFPDEPILTFKTVEQGYEVPYMGTTPERYLNVVVDFTDGDGDIGLDAGDTLDPFGVNDAHYFNCMCVLEKRIEGEWAGVQSEVPGRIKRISPSGQDPTLNGDDVPRGPRAPPEQQRDERRIRTSVAVSALMGTWSHEHMPA